MRKKEFALLLLAALTSTISQAQLTSTNTVTQCAGAVPSGWLVIGISRRVGACGERYPYSPWNMMTIVNADALPHGTTLEVCAGFVGNGLPAWWQFVSPYYRTDYTKCNYGYPQGNNYVAVIQKKG